MNTAKALTIAISAMTSERKKYAFDANIARQSMTCSPLQRNSLTKYDQLTDAIRTLEAYREAIKQGLIATIDPV